MPSNKRHPTEEATSSAASKKRWDVFVCHASEDKATFVEPLAAALKEFGLNVWYDKFILLLGDSLSTKINEGLAQSSFGLVVLSPSFLDKNWTKYELSGLTAREVDEGQTVILPIWYKINKKDLLSFSSPLADKFAVDSTGLTPLQIAVKIIEVIRPDLFQRIVRRRAYLENLQDAKIVYLDPATIIHAPVQHATLSADLVRRIRLVRASLLHAWPHSMDFWLDNFKRDSHPSSEVAVWERIALVYMEYCASHPELTSEQHKRLFAFILGIDCVDMNSEMLKAASANLPPHALEEVLQSYRSELPLHDVAGEEKPHSQDFAGTEDGSYAFGDKEHFPNDVPDQLIRKIIATERNDD